MEKSDRFERIAVIITVCCTVLLTGLGVSRHFSPERVAIRPLRQPAKVTDWPRVTDGGHRSGDSAAKVTVVEFADFECPSCQDFARNVKPIIARQFGSSVAFVYRHYPLSYHRLAMPYAIASECAAEQGRFWAFHDLVFAKSDSMGLKSIESFARDAGISNSDEFAKCLASGRNRDRITRDVEEAKRIGSTGTPTLLVNGLRLGLHDSTSLVAEIRSALDRVK